MAGKSGRLTLHYLSSHALPVTAQQNLLSFFPGLQVHRAAIGPWEIPPTGRAVIDALVEKQASRTEQRQDQDAARTEQDHSEEQHSDIFEPGSEAVSSVDIHDSLSSGSYAWPARSAYSLL